MKAITKEQIENFFEEISLNNECFLGDWSDQYGNGSLYIAIMNGDFSDEFIIDYLTGDDSRQFLKSSINKSDFAQRLAEIMEIHERISEAEFLIAKAVNVLGDYNRRIDKAFDSAMNAFWENSSHNPKQMLIELLEDSIREP